MKVEYIDHMGNDLSVIRAATASFAKDPVEWDDIVADEIEHQATKRLARPQV